MPSWWFNTTVKFISPIILTALLVWNLIDLFVVKNGNYGGYPQWALIVGGWLITALVLLSGVVVRIIMNKKKKKGFVELDLAWED